MEELESFFEVFFAGIVIVISMIASAKKAKNKRVAEAAKQSRALEQAAARPAPIRKPAEPIILPPVTFSDVPGQVLQPTVHAHLQPDCETHDAPGSLGAVSTEGKDPCHEEQLSHPRMTEEAAPAEQGGLSFSWTGSDLVKAVVMQEVLTRPAQRRAR